MPSTTSPLRTDGLGVTFAGHAAIQRIEFELRAGSITALVGPNGSGKSTLLRALARVLRPSSGMVVLDGHDIHKLPSREVARRMALLPQDASAPEGLSVRRLVELGRQPHLGRLGLLRAADHKAVEWALRAADVAQFAERAVDTLSGGERQRAWLALALAQETPLLLLDEPTTFLDVRHQLDVLKLVRRLNREHGLTVCWVLHDLNAAAAFSDSIVCLRGGRVIADGPPEDLLNPELMRLAFDVEAAVVTDPNTGRRFCLPYA